MNVRRDVTLTIMYMILVRRDVTLTIMYMILVNRYCNIYFNEYFGNINDMLLERH